MVRLMLVLAPVACILSGISVSTVLTTYMKVRCSFYPPYRVPCGFPVLKNCLSGTAVTYLGYAETAHLPLP